MAFLSVIDDIKKKIKSVDYDKQLKLNKLLDHLLEKYKPKENTETVSAVETFRFESAEYELEQNARLLLSEFTNEYEKITAEPERQPERRETKQEPRDRFDQPDRQEKVKDQVERFEINIQPAIELPPADDREARDFQQETFIEEVKVTIDNSVPEIPKGLPPNDASACYIAAITIDKNKILYEPHVDTLIAYNIHEHKNGTRGLTATEYIFNLATRHKLYKKLVSIYRQPADPEYVTPVFRLLFAEDNLQNRTVDNKSFLPTLNSLKVIHWVYDEYKKWYATATLEQAMGPLSHAYVVRKLNTLIGTIIRNFNVVDRSMRSDKTSMDLITNASAIFSKIKKITGNKLEITTPVIKALVIDHRPIQSDEYIADYLVYTKKNDELKKNDDRDRCFKTCCTYYLVNHGSIPELLNLHTDFTNRVITTDEAIGKFKALPGLTNNIVSETVKKTFYSAFYKPEEMTLLNDLNTDFKSAGDDVEKLIFLIYCGLNNVRYNKTTNKGFHKNVLRYFLFTELSKLKSAGDPNICIDDVSDLIDCLFTWRKKEEYGVKVKTNILIHHIIIMLDFYPKTTSATFMRPFLYFINHWNYLYEKYNTIQVRTYNDKTISKVFTYQTPAKFRHGKLLPYQQQMYDFSKDGGAGLDQPVKIPYTLSIIKKIYAPLCDIIDDLKTTGAMSKSDLENYYKLWSEDNPYKPLVGYTSNLDQIVHAVNGYTNEPKKIPVWSNNIKKACNAIYPNAATIPAEDAEIKNVTNILGAGKFDTAVLGTFILTAIQNSPLVFEPSSDLKSSVLDPNETKVPIGAPTPGPAAPLNIYAEYARLSNEYVTALSNDRIYSGFQIQLNEIFNNTVKSLYEIANNKIINPSFAGNEITALNKLLGNVVVYPKFDIKKPAVPASKPIFSALRAVSSKPDDATKLLEIKRITQNIAVKFLVKRLNERKDADEDMASNELSTLLKIIDSLETEGYSDDTYADYVLYLHELLMKLGKLDGVFDEVVLAGVYNDRLYTSFMDKLTKLVDKNEIIPDLSDKTAVDTDDYTGGADLKTDRKIDLKTDRKIDRKTGGCEVSPMVVVIGLLVLLVVCLVYQLVSWLFVSDSNLKYESKYTYTEPNGYSCLQ